MARRNTPSAARPEVKRRRKLTPWGKLLEIVVGSFILVAVMAGLGAAAVVGLYFYYASDPALPGLDKVAEFRPGQMTRVLDRNGVVVGEIGTERRTAVPLAKMPKDLINAVLAAEDPSFFQHGGLDYRGILRAAVDAIRERRFVSGGSTITQQVVKNILLSREKTLRRKFQEWILARRLSEKLSKEQVLEIYLNLNNYGAGRYGCEEGARYYFGKSVSELGTGEAAMLAGMPQIPAKLDPRKHPQAAKNRQCYVLRRMALEGMLVRDRAERLCAEPIVLSREPPPRANLAPEAVTTVLRMLGESYGPEKINTLGLSVQTTLDAQMQGWAWEAVERGLEEIDARQGYRGPSGHLEGKQRASTHAVLAAAHGKGLRDTEIVDGIVDRVQVDPRNPRFGKIFIDVGRPGVVDLAEERRYTIGDKPLAQRLRPGDVLRVRSAPERRRSGESGEPVEIPLALDMGPQAAMVVMVPQTREIRALVGGYGFRTGGFDRSQRALRQAGSTFKPFVYAAAIDSKKYTAASVVNDTPEVYSLWKPQNYEKETFQGPVRLRTALAHSINTVAIKLLADVGLPAVRGFASRAGYTAALPDGLGLSAALGAGTVTPIDLASAYASFAAGGKVGTPYLVTSMGANTNQPPTLTYALRPETAYVMVSLMRSVIEEGTGRAAATAFPGRPLAGKTGTSNGSKDAWFIGFSPDLLAAVWVGFDDGKPIGRGEAGARTALPMWIDFMSHALANRPATDFPQPTGVMMAIIDRATGLLASAGSEGIDEVFLIGTEPTEIASAPGERPADSDTELLDR